MNYSSFGVRSIGALAAVGLFAVPLAAFASVSVSIEALSPSTNLTVGQGVSFNIVSSGFINPTYAVSDSLGSSSIGNSDINSSGDFAWTPGNNDVGTHNLTITVSDSQGDSAQTQETLTVSAPASVSIGALTPSSSVVSGQTVTFVANTSGFTNPSFSVSDGFSGSSVTNASINSSGQFSWTPAGSSQNGSHSITVYVTDSLGHSAQASETINVQSAPTLTIQSLSPGTSANPGQTVTFTASAANFSSSPTYSLSDTYGGSSINNADINSSGNFTWVPTQNDDGTHTITVFANDTSGHSASASQTISIGGTPVNGGASIQGFTSGSTVIIGQPVTFTVVASGFSNPVFSIGDSFGGGSSISNSDINSAGYFSWTPGNSDIGTHTLTIFVNDSSGHSSNVAVTLTVGQANISIVSLTPGTSVVPGALLTFSLSQQGFVNPTYTVSDSFAGTSVSSSDINSSGQFTWTPLTSDDGMHTITVYATDSSGHSANTSIAIDVAPTTAPAVTTTSSTSLGQLEALLQQDETQIASLGGSTGAVTGTYVFTEELTPGMSDTQVSQLQTLLAQKGYFSGSATGYYGAQTEAAVKAFQAAHGLTQVGVVGPATRAALNALMVPESSASASTSTTVGDGYVFSTFIGLGYSGTDVTELQKRLQAFGYFSGSITGYFGSLTQAAVKAFQAAHGITQAGYVGPSTRAALDQ